MKTTINTIIIFLGTFLSLTSHAQHVIAVNTDEAKAIIESQHGSGFVIIDGRSVSMYNESHIEGAVLINAYEEDASKRLKVFLEKDSIMIYCSTNSRTRVLTNLLTEAEYEGTIITVTDGIRAWIKKEYPVVVLEEPVQFE